MLSIEDKEELRKIIHEELNKEFEIELIDDALLPFYAHKGDAGLDLRSMIDIDIKPGQTVLIPLGFKLNIPFGYEVQIRPRSGLSFKTPLRVANTPGTIDSGYKDEICAIITNTSLSDTGTYDIGVKNNEQGTYHIKKGDRIAQMVVARYVNVSFNVVEKISCDDNRGGGFGHSGVN